MKFYMVFRLEEISEMQNALFFDIFKGNFVDVILCYQLKTFDYVLDDRRIVKIEYPKLD